MTADVTKMMYMELRKEWERILDEARPRVAPRCKACKECDSLRPKCGFVSSERGKSGERNYAKLQQIRLACDTMYEGGNGDEVDSSCDFFGYKMSAPVFNAPIAWVKNAFPDSHFKKPGMERVDGRAMAPAIMYSMASSAFMTPPDAYRFMSCGFSLAIW